jgi:hypothetical protein
MPGTLAPASLAVQTFSLLTRTRSTIFRSLESRITKVSFNRSGFALEHAAESSFTTTTTSTLLDKKCNTSYRFQFVVAPPMPQGAAALFRGTTTFSAAPPPLSCHCDFSWSLLSHFRRCKKFQSRRMRARLHQKYNLALLRSVVNADTMAYDLYVGRHTEPNI